MPSPFYSASVALFQLHGAMVSHMQALATPSCTHYLDTYHWKHISFGCLFLRQWCRDVASGADRHLDIGLQVVEAHPLFPYFLEKRLAIHTSPFFIYILVNGFFVTCFRTFFAEDPLSSFNWWAVLLGGVKIKMESTSTPSVIEPTRPYFSLHRKAKAKRPNRKKIGI